MRVRYGGVASLERHTLLYQSVLYSGCKCAFLMHTRGYQRTRAARKQKPEMPKALRVQAKEGKKAKKARDMGAMTLPGPWQGFGKKPRGPPLSYLRLVGADAPAYPLSAIVKPKEQKRQR